MTEINSNTCQENSAAPVTKAGKKSKIITGVFTGINEKYSGKVNI